VLVEQLGGTLMTIAKDAKIQVEFNPAKVGAYRLIGYENRMLRAEDFRDDKKDAGEIGAGHTVTALYELVPPGTEKSLPKVDPLRFQEPGKLGAAAQSDDVLLLKLAYKKPDGQESDYLEFPAKDGGKPLEEATPDFRFAAAVACFGMLLRDSPHMGQSSWDLCLQLAQGSQGQDQGGYRREFIELVKTARALRAQ
jgi:Ca-activated chloride channel family protein